MNEKKIDLKNPVTVDGVEFTSLTMRSPKVKDFVAGETAVPKEGSARAIWLTAMLCGVSPATIEELHMGDFNRLQAAMKGFLS